MCIGSCACACACISLLHLPSAIFLLDAHYEVYVWLGWWPEQRNKLLKEANMTAGSAHSRWLKDKKLAMETAINYAKGVCGLQCLLSSFGPH